ncbi:uncharacterized protein LOC144711319 [Wolffia australiana]
MKRGRMNGFICNSPSSTAVLGSTVISRRPNRILVDRGGVDVKYSRLVDSRRQAVAKRESRLQLVPSHSAAPPPERRLQLVPLPAAAPPERRLQIVQAKSLDEATLAATKPLLRQRPTEHDLQVVVMKVSIHCEGCAGKVRKLLSKMDGVTSVRIDLDEKRVTVQGHVSPAAVLESVCRVKRAELWPSLELSRA